MLLYLKNEKAYHHFRGLMRSFWISKKGVFKPIKGLGCALLLAVMWTSPSFGEMVGAGDDGFPLLGKVQVEDGRLSLKAKGMALEDVLLRISHAAGFKIRFYGDIRNPVNLSLDRVPLLQGMQRLLNNYSWLVIYGRNTAARPDTPGKEISEVMVLDGRDSGSPFFDFYPGAGHSQIKTPTQESPGYPDRFSGLEVFQQLDQFDESTAILLLDRIIKRDADPFIRGQAVTALADFGTKHSITSMGAAIGDDDVAVRHRAVDGLGRVGGEQAIQLLGQVLFSESDPQVRRSAIRMLATHTDQPSSRAFLRAALKDADEEVRVLALQALDRE